MSPTFRVAAILAAAALFAAPAAAQVAPGWAGDVRELLAAMDSIHPAPYRVHGREEWERAARGLEARLPTLRYHQFVAELGRIVALAGDGHTRLGQVQLQDHQRAVIMAEPGEGFEARYPVEFELFADGLYAVRASADHAALFGRKVVAINGVATAEVFARLRPYISADNDAWRWYLFPRYVASPAYLAAAGVAVSPSTPVRLSLGDPAQPTDVELMPVESVDRWVDADQRLRETGRRPRYRALESRYAFEHLEDARTVYVRIREIQDQASEPLAAFADRLFRFVDSVEAARLVLDLRGNGGGNNYLNQPLVHGLIRAARVNRPGGLFVITDRGTFSAAISLLADVERNTHALIVGEPAGAPANHYGDSRRVKLPASGVEVRISTVYWQHSDPRDPRQWILPDLPVRLGFADWLAGRDPALEAVLSYRHDPAAPVRRPNTNWGRPSQRTDPPAFIGW